MAEEARAHRFQLQEGNLITVPLGQLVCEWSTNADANPDTPVVYTVDPDGKHTYSFRTHCFIHCSGEIRKEPQKPGLAVFGPVKLKAGEELVVVWRKGRYAAVRRV